MPNILWLKREIDSERNRKERKRDCVCVSVKDCRRLIIAQTLRPLDIQKDREKERQREKRDRERNWKEREREYVCEWGFFAQKFERDH